MLRVGCIPYLNCEPFFFHLRGVKRVPLNPRRLGQAIAAGELDAGPLSIVDHLRLEPELAPLPFGIATAGPARSVLVFSERPLTELGGAVIGVTSETSTSVELLRVLLALKHEVAPAGWVTPDESCAATLLIGDEAIRRLTRGPAAPCVTDLGAEWSQWTGLPFVFARWAVRTVVPEAERLALASSLDRALDRGLESLSQIARARRDTGWREREVVAYLRGFTYRLGANEEKAMAEFNRLRAFVAGRGAGEPSEYGDRAGGGSC